MICTPRPSLYRDGMFPAKRFAFWLSSPDIRSILRHIKSKDVNNADYLGLSVTNQADPDKSVSVSFRRADQMVSEVITNAIAKVVQSNESFLISSPITLSVHHVAMPVGRGRCKRSIQLSEFDDFCLKKRSIIVINISDNLCLARAIVIGMSRHKDDLRTQKKVIRDVGLIQTERSRALCIELGIDLTNGGGLNELSQFQRGLRGWKITVFTDRKGRDVLFEGSDCDNDNDDEHPRKRIDLIYGNGHYNVITSLTGAFNCGYYCTSCKQPYNTLKNHVCSKKCVRCGGSKTCKKERDPINCNDCGRMFFGRDCFNNHVKIISEAGVGMKSVCSQVKKCTACSKVYKTAGRKTSHVCGELYCAICKSFYTEEHYCYMQPDTAEKVKNKNNDLYVFFDLECRQDEALDVESSVFQHVPVLCVVQQACKVCWDIADHETLCAICGIKQHIFDSADPVADFFKYLRLPRPNFSSVICIAHNLKGYDGQFLLKHVVSDMKIIPEVLLTGTKIMTMRVNNITFKDSLNFLPMPLSKLPKTLNIGNDLMKGFFPHFFNTMENVDYVGPLPSKKFYGYETMTNVDKKDFDKWYDDRKISSFNLREEMKMYCVNDVDILRRACTKFSSIYEQLTRVHIFKETLTIAGASLLTFKRNFLKKNSIGIVPEGGYRWRDRQSHIAIMWLLAEEEERGVSIKHAGNGHEIRFKGRKVDGVGKEDGAILMLEWKA
ncbi:hypothetical protein J437_LFUL019255 [Ladona fulva]|uniref:DNA-directed DNA polymerase n=1 Tax=Ladona fulva TaxID=123851 RepID=A0A8K0KRL1_LADFU|nr:hypothetical protein J437_LFUL019255 [Ladona fulva]